MTNDFPIKFLTQEDMLRNEIDRLILLLSEKTDIIQEQQKEIQELKNRLLLSERKKYEQIREYCQQNPEATLAEIADFSKTSIPYICQTLKKHSIPYKKRYRKSKGSRTLEITEFIEKNPKLGLKEIADKFKVSHQYISELKRKQNDK